MNRRLDCHYTIYNLLLIAITSAAVCSLPKVVMGQPSLASGAPTEPAASKSPFTDNHDGTITDNYTGLIWQKVDSGECTFEQASANAKSLKLAGHDDWRLPTQVELLSLVNHSYNPAIDRNFFPSHATSQAEYWWTNQPSGSDRVWVVNRGGGTGAKRKDQAFSAGGDANFNARYVRGTPREGHHQYTPNKDGTVTDGATGLMWITGPAPAMAWAEAVRYPKTLDLGGYKDWRLPDVKELASLIDYKILNAVDAHRKVPCLDQSVFSKAAADFYWSATRLRKPNGTEAWYVDFAGGNLRYDPEQTKHPFFVVRTATPVERLVVGPSAWFHPEDAPTDQPPNSDIGRRKPDKSSKRGETAPPR